MKMETQASCVWRVVPFIITSIISFVTTREPTRAICAEHYNAPSTDRQLYVPKNYLLALLDDFQKLEILIVFNSLFCSVPLIPHFDSIRKLYPQVPWLASSPQAVRPCSSTC